MKKALIFCMLIPLLGCFPEAIPPEVTDWEYDLPSRNGLDDASLMRINDSIINRSYDQLNTMIILKDNKIVYEKYYYDQFGLTDRRGLVDLGRMTLLVTGTSLGIAIENNELFDLNTPIHTLLPDYEDVFNDNQEKRQITIRNLLVHTAGFSWNETLTPFGSAANDINIMKSENDWVRYILEKPLESSPGLRYGYNSASGVILSKIVESISGTTLEDYLTSNLFTPLRIESWEWASDPNGTTDGATGLRLSLYDLTKVTSVYLDEGKWKGKFIMDPDWALDASMEQIAFGFNYGFGYHWWTFSDTFTPNQILPINDTFYFPNEKGDHIYVIPHQNIIITMGAQNPFYGFYNPSLFLYFDVVRTIRPN